MSLNHFSLPNQSSSQSWAAPRFDNLQLDHGLNMLNSDINNVRNINGLPFSAIESHNIIIWKPSATLPREGNIFRDWSGAVSVKSQILESNGCLLIYCDATSPCIIDSSTDFQSRVCMTSAVCNQFSSPLVVQIQDGVVLTNLLQISKSFILSAAPTIVEPLFFDSNECFFLTDGALLQLQAGATKGFINLVGSNLSLIMNRFSQLDSNGVVGVPIIKLDSTSGLQIIRSINSTISDDSLVGPIGAAIIDVRDSSCKAFTNASFFGTFTPFNLDNSNKVIYDDSLVLPALPGAPSTVQDAIDAVKVLGSGYVSFAGGAPILNEIPTFANINGLSIHKSSIAGGSFVGALSMPSLTASTLLSLNGSKVVVSFAAGSSGQVLQSNGVGASYSTCTYPANSGGAGKILISDGTNNVYSTPTYPINSATSGKLLRSDGTNFAPSTSTFADTYAINTLLYNASANTVSGLATGNNGVLITSAGGVPSISSTLPGTVQTNITALGTISQSTITQTSGTASALFNINNTLSGSPSSAGLSISRVDTTNGGANVYFKNTSTFVWSLGTSAGDSKFYLQDYTNAQNTITITSGSGNTSNFTFTGSFSCGNDVTISSGHCIINTLGKTLKVKQGSNACSGTGAVMVAGSVTVATTAVATGDTIFLSRTAIGGTIGPAYISAINNGVSFVITAIATDTSTFSWLIVKPS